jgi:hypothetical protein
MKQSLRLTPQRIERKIKQAFKSVNFAFQRRLVQEITDDKWRWSDGGLRDIVDTGLLRNSQQPPNFLTDLHAVHVNTAAYAMPVHEGATFKTGAVLPARPWMTTALKEFDFVAAMKKAYKGGNLSFEVKR